MRKGQTKERRRPFAIVDTVSTAECRQAYASGVAAAQIGGGVNPYPAGSRQHASWAGGHAEGQRERLRGG
jgi:hypothetical protein